MIIKSEESDSLGTHFIGAIAFNLFVWAIIIFAQPGVPVFGYAILGVFALLAFVMLYSAIQHALGRKQFGIIPLDIQEALAYSGGKLQAVMEVEQGLDAGVPVTCTLKCIETWKESTSGRSRVRNKDHWSGEFNTVSRRSVLGSRIDIDMDIPSHLPRSNYPGEFGRSARFKVGRKYYRWELFVEASMPGTNLARTYKLEVLPRPDKMSVDERKFKSMIMVMRAELEKGKTRPQLVNKFADRGYPLPAIEKAMQQVIGPDYRFSQQEMDEEVKENRAKATGKARSFMKFFAYPLFLIHVLGFGVGSFVFGYMRPEQNLEWVYGAAGLGIPMYIAWYFFLFGVDEVKWMFINATLGLLGIYFQLSGVLHAFDRDMSDYPLMLHVITGTYIVLYVFLLRQFMLDIFFARKHPLRRKIVENGFWIIMLALAVFVDLDEIVEKTGGKKPSKEAVITLGKKDEQRLLRDYEAASRTGDTSRGNGKLFSDKIAGKLGAHYWDQRRYADAYKYYRLAYREAQARDMDESERNRSLATYSAGIMISACVLKKWEVADNAMAELKQRYPDIKRKYQKKLDYWIKTGEPRLAKRKC